jgi:telomerase Cajal body protein 1
VAGYPFFNLQDPSTTLILSSVRDHPVRLNSALSGQVVASYPLVNPMTEEYICSHSLLFSAQGDRFLAGSESLISTFDVSRPGNEPISSIPTGPKRRRDREYNGAVNMRGIVSALDLDASSGVLAAGTYSRCVGLYESSGQGACIGVFSVKGTTADDQIGGGGITQISWSPCGKYLYIAERKSDGVMLYDIRKTGQLLAWLQGRNAQTNQRLAVDVVAAEDGTGQEIWAGGLGGLFRMWKNPHQHEGSVRPTFEFKGHEGKESSQSGFVDLMLT